MPGLTVSMDQRLTVDVAVQRHNREVHCIANLSAESGKYLVWLGLRLFGANPTGFLKCKQALQVFLLSDQQTLRLASKPHLDKLCGTCGGMLHCTVIWKRKCKTHETRTGCNYCLRAVVRLRKVYCVLVVKDILFTVGSTFSTLYFNDENSFNNVYCIFLLQTFIPRNNQMQNILLGFFLFILLIVTYTYFQMLPTRRLCSWLSLK